MVSTLVRCLNSWASSDLSRVRSPFFSFSFVVNFDKHFFVRPLEVSRECQCFVPMTRRRSRCLLLWDPLEVVRSSFNDFVWDQAVEFDNLIDTINVVCRMSTKMQKNHSLIVK
jgi:hypothetical protein